MDFSSLSDKTSNLTLQSLSQDELLEQFSALKGQYDNLSKQYETSQQELYDAKKNSHFAQELKEHLESEIEACQKNEARFKQEYAQKTQNHNDELESVRQEKWNEIESFKNTIETLQNKIKILEENSNNVSDKSICQLDNTKFIDEARKLEEENNLLKNTIVEHRTALAENSNLINDLNNQVKTFEEYIESLKCNLESKKEEIVSLKDMLHSAQDDLCGANAELQRFKNEAGTHAVKGNSLFAEVDDKRQEMLKTLSHMKEKVHQLNRELISKQAEIDSLLCEKKTLWEEYTGQADHHDAVLNRAYETRITDLEKQCEQLHREIARWYEKNLDPDSSEVTSWVAGVLDYYRDENDRLSSDFAASSVDNLVKEQKLRDLQRQLVAWRTKAIEANASISQLATKLQLAEKIVTATPTVIQEPVPANNKASPVLKTEVKIEKYSEVDGEKENVIPDGTLKENDKLKGITNKPGILVTAGAKNKPTKKATFQ